MHRIWLKDSLTGEVRGTNSEKEARRLIVTGGSAASNVGSSRFVLVQNTGAVGTDYLVTVEVGTAEVVSGSFRINGDSSVIIKKGTADIMFAENAALFLTGVTVTTI